MQGMLHHCVEQVAQNTTQVRTCTTAFNHILNVFIL